MEVFHCFICHHLPKTKIYTCLAGHIICSECRCNLEKCNCKEDICCCRNFELEIKVFTGLFECPFQVYGCDEKVLLKDYGKHKLECKFRPKCCPRCTLELPVNTKEYDIYKKLSTKFNIAALQAAQKVLAPVGPWLNVGPPEPIEGVGPGETVMMDPVDLGPPTADVQDLFEDGRKYDVLTPPDFEPPKRMKHYN